MLNGLDLFSGIGGLGLALSPWVRPVAYCENDRYAQSVLLARMGSGELPEAPIWDDIRTLDGSRIQPKPEIVYAGFPCQDISLAGAGAGLAGKRSGLFFEIIRLIGELRPKFVFLENVPAITLRGLDQILLEFASLGFDCRWTIVSAAEIGAPHLRERWFLLAYSVFKRLSESRPVETEKGSYRKESRSSIERRVQDEIWRQFKPDVCRMDDGLPVKIHRIRTLGNAVVPLQAREAFMRLAGLQ